MTRGHQIKNGPLKGYRYDGLYYVTAFEKVKGKRGYYICRFHLSSESNIEELEGKLDGSLKSEYSSTKRSSTTIYRIKRNISLSEKSKLFTNAGVRYVMWFWTHHVVRSQLPGT